MSLSRSAWGVVVAVLFAIAAWATPVPEEWRPILIFLTWFALGLSCLGWLFAHFERTRRLRSHPAATQPVTLLIIFILGGSAALGAWLLVPKPLGEERPALTPFVIETKIQPVTKRLSIENKGTVSAYEVQLFVTRYELDRDAWNARQIKIANSSQLGGPPLINVPLLEKFSAPVTVDLATIGPTQFLSFDEWPKEEFRGVLPGMLKNYCFRITFRDSRTGEKYALYKVTSGIKGPSGFEDGVVSGGAVGPGEFIRSIPAVLINHNRTLWNDGAKDYGLPIMLVSEAASPPSAKEIADEVAKQLHLSPQQVGQTRAGLRAFLIPANDATPPNHCDEYPVTDRDSLKLALIGPAHVLYANREKPISLITIGDTSVLGIERAETGIVLNATLRDSAGRLLGEIRKNVWTPHTTNDLEVRSDDHQVLILNSNNDVVLFVRYLNPRTIKVLGTFNIPNHNTVIIEEGQILVGKGKLQMQLCALDIAREGSWMQMKSLLEVP